MQLFYFQKICPKIHTQKGFQHISYEVLSEERKATEILPVEIENQDVFAI
jgi:hypothetical protein